MKFILICSLPEHCKPSWLLLPDAIATAACQSLSCRLVCFPRPVLVGYINILKIRKHAVENSEKYHGVIDDIEETMSKQLKRNESRKNTNLYQG